MKSLLVGALVVFGSVFTAKASDAKNTVLVKERANRVSNKMIRDLRLNNYQANEVREINNEIIAKIATIESEFEGNQQLIDQKIETILAERDTRLEHVLSTVQYNNYFGKRPVFNQVDKEFVANANTVDYTTGSAAAVNTVK